MPDRADTVIDETLADAEACHRRGDVDAALRGYERVLDIDVDHVRALLMCGVALREQGNVSASLDRLERAVQLAPTRLECLNQLAITQMANGDLVAANRTLRELLSIDDSALSALANLGALAQHRGRLAQAIECYQRYLEAAPTDIDVHCNLANAMADTGRGDEALQALTAASASVGEHVRLAATRGAVLCAMERFDEAIVPLETALADAPADDMALINYAMALRKIGRGNDAEQALRRACRTNPDNARATADLSRWLIVDGRGQDACIECERFLSYHPAERLVLASYFLALRSVGRGAEADNITDLGLVDVSELETGIGVAEHQRLARAIADHPSLLAAPVSKATTGGGQTGEFDGDEWPELAALVESINAAVGHYVRRLSERVDARHPAVLPMSESWSLRVWATVLPAGGFQQPHIHPLAWLSGVYYLAVPPNMRSSSPDAGALEFGGTPDGLDVDAPRLTIDPAVGRLVLFPSYYYHGTQPFEAPEDRVSLAFDVVPGFSVHR